MSSTEPSSPPPVSSGDEPATVVEPVLDQNDRNLALITHLSGIFFSFIMPLIIWLVHKDQPEKAGLSASAKEALNFQITILIASFAGLILIAVLIGIVLLPLVGVVNLIFCILAAVQINSTGSYRYPFALRLIR